MTKILKSCGLSILLLALLAANVFPAKAAALQAGPSDPAEMEAFFDGLMTARMEADHIPGAVVSVVKDGQLFFAKGYGYADLEQRIPVDPERTLFRPGSVSKLFVWTSVMQLVEQGKLSLDVDINQYLDFTIPATFAEPITLENLLTHTPGFEDKGDGLFLLRAEDMGSLESFVKNYMPARVFPPGKLGAYSNYGTALAGYIVQRVSGMPFDEYVEKNILLPLGMTHSTFRQPLPAALAPDMAQGYNFVGGEYLKGGFEFIQAYPAGALSATATDMAKFMIAHLQNGTYGDVQILQAATAQQMHGNLFSHDPRIDGMAYGFFVNTVNGLRVISHGGDTILFHTGLFLIPEQNVGLFVSTNGVGGASNGEAVMKAFLDRYYPGDESSDPQPPADFAQRIAPYLGEYMLARSNFTTFEKVISLTSPVNISVNGDGYLVVSMMGQVTQYVEIEPGLLQNRLEPADRAVYMMDESGQRYILPSAPFAFMQTPWYATLVFNGFLLILGLVLIVGALIGWLMDFFRWLRQRERRPLGAILGRVAAALFGLLFLFFVILFFSLFADILPAYGVPRIFFEVPPIMSVAMVLPIILALAAVLMLVFMALAWIKRYWKLKGRIHYTILTLSALSLVWLLVYWNLLF